MNNHDPCDITGHVTNHTMRVKVIHSMYGYIRSYIANRIIIQLAADGQKVVRISFTQAQALTEAQPVFTHFFGPFIKVLFSKIKVCFSHMVNCVRDMVCFIGIVIAPSLK